MWEAPNHNITCMALHSSEPPPPPSPPNPLFLKKGEVNFDYLPQRRGSEKVKKGGGSMVQGQVFLKVGAGAFPIYFF